MPALFKILVGYVLAGGFLAWGQYLEKKTQYVKWAWGILGGGWGLLYLSTYAMYFIPVTRIIDNPWLEIALLAVVSVAAVVYNLRYRSWVVTAITFVLAFITAGLGGLDYPMLGLWALLTTSIAVISIRCQWEKFFIFALSACYLTDFYFLEPHSFWSSSYVSFFNLPAFEFQLSMALLLISWLVFSKTLLFFPERKDQPQLLVTADILNAGFFTMMGLYNIYRARPNLTMSWDPRFWFLIVFAGIYFLLACSYKWLHKPGRIVAAVSTAFTLLAMAILIKFPRLSVSYFWTLETVMLFVLGVYYRALAYRVLAAVLGGLVFIRLLVVDLFSYKTYQVGAWSVQHNVALLSLAAATFFLMAFLAKKAEEDQRLIKDESSLYNVLPFAAAVLLVSLLGEEVHARWLTLSWGLVGSAVLGAGFLIDQKSFRIAGLCVLALSFFHLIFVDMGTINTVYKIVAFLSLGGVLLLLSYVYSSRMIKK